MPDDRSLPRLNETSDVWEDILPPVLMALGAVSLLRTSRVLSLALLGGWLYHTATKSELKRQKEARLISSNIDEELEDSFPASDPPSFSGNTAGRPD